MWGLVRCWCFLPVIRDPNTRRVQKSACFNGAVYTKRVQICGVDLLFRQQTVNLQTNDERKVITGLSVVSALSRARILSGPEVKQKLCHFICLVVCL